MPGFTHRALNGWITDLATQPDPDAAWPSMRLDERLLQDYRETFAQMRRVGFNEIVIWGLYTANNWPLDLKSAVPMERGRRVEQLIASAHEHGIKVLSGLGTYSWGFAEIIKANPKLNGGNGNALCASEPESHAWMERVLDFVLTRFPIDGVSMQSADQGRCKCATLRNARGRAVPRPAAGPHRGNHPHQVAWQDRRHEQLGHQLRPSADKETLVKLSRSLDYMIDHNDSACYSGPAYRRELIAALSARAGHHRRAGRGAAATLGTRPVVPANMPTSSHASAEASHGRRASM